MTEMKLDWRSEKEYDYLNGLSFPQIAFEFLRRNGQYTSDYEEYSKIEATLESKFGCKEDNYEEWRKAGALGLVLVTTKAPDGLATTRHREPEVTWLRNSENSWLKRSGSLEVQKALNSDTPPRRYWYEDWYRLKWGILSEEFPDPTKLLSGPLEFDLNNGFPTMPDYEHIGEFFHGDGDEYGTYEPWSQRPGSALLVFDLESPLPAQLKSAKEMLKKRMKLDKKRYGIQPFSTYQKDEFIELAKRYLRILDADLDDAKNEEIGVVLYGDDSQKEDIYYNAKILSDNRSRAQLFRDLKYRAIPTYKTISG